MLSKHSFFAKYSLFAKRSFLLSGGLIAAAVVVQADAPAAGQVAMFEPGDYGRANLFRRQSASDADSFIVRSGGAFEPIRALLPDDEYRRAARSVGRVDVVLREESGREVMAACTGTLLPRGYVLTNHHCIPAAGNTRPLRASILMNYLDQDGGDSRRFELSVTPVESSDKLDFSIVRVQGDASAFEGVRLSDAPVQPGQSLVVIHHPQGRPIVMTRFRCQAYSQQPDEYALRHRCDTLPGSSGAMIFTSGLKGVALHFAGGLDASDDHSFNLSTRMTALLGVSSVIRAILAPGDAGELGRSGVRLRQGTLPTPAGRGEDSTPPKPAGERMDPNDILRAPN